MTQSRLERLSETVSLYLGDCHEILPSLEGADTIVCDPPYGIDYSHSGGNGSGSVGVTGAAKKRGNPKIVGDDRPFDPAPFLRYRNVILWGADHFYPRLPDSGRFLAFNKLGDMRPWDSFSDVEFAWQNRDAAARIFNMKWKGIACDKRGEDNGVRLHVTQKPIRLMRWCIEQLAPPHRCDLRSLHGKRHDRRRCRANGVRLCWHRNRRRLFRYCLPPHRRGAQAAHAVCGGRGMIARIGRLQWEKTLVALGTSARVQLVQDAQTRALVRRGFLRERAPGGTVCITPTGLRALADGIERGSLDDGLTMLSRSRA